MKASCWAASTIGELFNIGAGKSVTPVARNGERKHPFLRTSNIFWGKIDLRGLDSMHFTDEEIASKDLRKGDLLVCEGGDIGRSAIWNSEIAKCSFQNHLHRLRPKANDIVPRFFMYYLQAGFTQLGIYEGAGNKTTIPNLSRSRLQALEVPKPEKVEQEKIAAVLWKVQRAIEVEEKLITTARELKQSTMRQLFSQGLRGESQKETEIGLLPKTWKIVQLGDQAVVISKGSSPKWQGFKYTSEGVLFVRSQNIGEGRMEWSDRSFLPPAWNEKEKRSILKAGDVLINLVGASIGRAAVGDPEIEGANCNQAVSFVRLKPDTLNALFLVGFLLDEAGQRQIHTSKKDIARANLSLENVRSLVVPKPSLTEQHEIASTLQTIDRKISVHERKRATLQELFKTLLHQLMTGQIRVHNLDIDTSEVENV